jgi:TonB family protein
VTVSEGIGLKFTKFGAPVILTLISVWILPVESQPANPANREYGRTTLIKKTSVANPSNNNVAPSSNSSSVREYTSHSLTKASGNANDEYQSYVDNLEKKLSNVQGPQKFLGQIAVTCLVGKNGTISDAKVSKSSQMPQVDAAALKAVQAAGPVAPMPSYRNKPVMVQVTFDGTSSSTTTHAVVKNP